MLRSTIALLFCLLVWFSSGCTPTESTPTPTPDVSTPSETTTETILPEDVATTLKAAIADELEISADAITVQTAEAVEWNDACLGAAQPDEGCAQVITPGYRVVFATPTGEVVVHSDRTGSSYRVVSS